jgi:hypothetical protein
MLNTHMLSQNYSRLQKQLNNIKGKKNKVLKHKNINYFFHRNKFNPDIDKSKYADTFGGNLLGAGRRAIPSWR